MSKNHTLLEVLGVSNEDVNNIVGFCLDNGAYGAKLTGAGGGGSVIALIPNECKMEFLSKISKKNSLECIPIRIKSCGLLRY
jgi:mevalonate kinase